MCTLVNFKKCFLVIFKVTGLGLVGVKNSKPPPGWPSNQMIIITRPPLI